MAKKLNSFERQASLSITLALIAGFCALGLLAAVVTAFDTDVMGVKYRSNSWRFYFIVFSTAGALAASAIGGLVALNSAGQKSNSRSSLSWMGFFANSGAFTLTACTFIGFWFLKVHIR